MHQYDLHENSYYCYIIGLLLLEMKAVVMMKKRVCKALNFHSVLS